ncbi:MAG: glucosamine-6-phosphate deaminase, partial [Planctomycetales bacterium]|nr:glucosamine-6-phosphate deaminase [Planctomycetales bacterium]
MSFKQSDRLTSLEKMQCTVLKHMKDACVAVARQIGDLIRIRAAEGRTCVLGLATGSTPVGVYNELVRMHQEEGLSFANVITFNLDEYYPMHAHELQSYVRFMNEHLFDLVDIQKQNVHIPDGTLPPEAVQQFCWNYEQKIKDAGGIDIQLLGIGRTGHIGFNEPGSGKGSRTRLITLDRVTRIDAASDFFGEENVPRRAITMGVGSILDAKKIIMLAFGEHKARIVAQAVEGEVTPVVAASFLQQHPNTQVVLDEAAASELTRMKTPWLVSDIKWDDMVTRRAVIWLAQNLNKPVLKLTDQEYNEGGLQDLLAEKGPAYNINLSVFRHLQATINGWPGGKPQHQKQPGDRDRPFDSIFPKRVVIFSPHPDDDVISMGGTLIRLVDQGHEVHIAYQTSGNIAVFDDDAGRFADFVAEFNRLFGIDPEQTAQLDAHVDEFLKNKKAGQVDSEIVQQIKGLIRRCEAKAGARCCGVPETQLHFMDLPFYETGRVKKKPLGEEDIQLT